MSGTQFLRSTGAAAPRGAPDALVRGGASPVRDAALRPAPSPAWRCQAELIMCVILRSRERRTAPAQVPFVFRVPRQRVIVGIISAAKRGAATVRNAQVHEVVSPLPIQPARRVGNGPNRHAIAWLDPLGFHGESFQPQHRRITHCGWRARRFHPLPLSGTAEKTSRIAHMRG